MAMAMASCVSPSTILCSSRSTAAINCLKPARVDCRRRPIPLAPPRASAAEKLSQKKDEDQEKEEELKQRMQALSSSMALPLNYLGQLPNDLRNDLQDAAFALANGPIRRECGEVAGEKLLQLSQAWEKFDTQAATLATEELQYVLPKDSFFRDAIGKRLIGAGKRFAVTGSYGKGELQMIANALTRAGEAMQSDIKNLGKEDFVMQTTRVLKFGDLQVELTPQKCFTGSFIALIFGVLSWGLAASVQNITDNNMQYANDNATQLATSLKGALLLLGYGCTLLSTFAMIGLVGLGFQLSGKSNTD